METLLKQAIDKAIFTTLDMHLAAFLAEKSHLTTPQDQQRLQFVVSYLSAETRAGHVCLDLHTLSPRNLFGGRENALVDDLYDRLAGPTLTDWQDVLARSGIATDGSINSPLVFDGQRLYFQRLWRNEQKVAHYFRTMASAKIADDNALADNLNQLFPKQDDAIDWQKIAVAMALTRQVAIISGGPGTGKTTTVAKLLAALITSTPTMAKPLRILAAAPTGKAAARLTQSLNQSMGKLLSASQIARSLPSEAVTLHRLLGAELNQNQFMYNQDNPLHVDILIVDEASMIDLSMMASLIDALPAHARLILLGDREQLSSVEAGAVLGDLCHFATGAFSAERVTEIASLTGYQLPSQGAGASIADNICLLQKSYRFDAQSGIGQLAAYVNRGESERAIDLLLKQEFADIHLHPFDADTDYMTLINHAVEGYSGYLAYIQQADFDIVSAIEHFSRFRLLAALREGRFGVTGLNQHIEQALKQQQLIQRQNEEGWYLGRPVMILKNYPSLGLYNGDIGITLPSTSNAQKMRVYFQLADGQVQGYSPYRLPPHETAYAMTVHKSQGSEFEHAALILPPEFSPLLSRSLLYTAITRAKAKMTLYSGLPILQRTIAHQVERQTGLPQAIM